MPDSQSVRKRISDPSKLHLETSMFSKVARWLPLSRSARPAASIRPLLQFDTLESRITPAADLVIDSGEVWNVGDAPSGPYKILQYFSRTGVPGEAGEALVG